MSRHIKMLYAAAVLLSLPVTGLTQDSGRQQFYGDPIEKIIMDYRSNTPQEERDGLEAPLQLENIDVNFIGHWPFGETRAVAVSGNVAFVGSGGGIYILNIADPSTPAAIGTIKTHSVVYGLSVSGSYLYVAGYEAGLSIVNISNPASPSMVATKDTPGSAQVVYATENYAYVADGVSGLRIIDISIPGMPLEKGYYNTHGSAEDVVVSGDQAYVADGTGGLRIIDISNPNMPRETGGCSVNGYASGIAVAGGYAFIAAEDLVVVNISDPQSPTVASSLSIPGSAKKLSVSGSYASVVDGEGLEIIDISDPSLPFSVGRYATQDYALALAVQGSLVYVSDSGSGLFIIDVSSPSAPSLKGFFDTPAYALDVAIQGHYAYVANGRFGGLRIIDLADPAAPVLVGHHDTPGLAQGIDVSGNYAYLADGYDGNLRIFDISNPASPSFIYEYITPGSPQNVTVVGSLAYIADGDAGLQIVDVSNPYFPMFVGSYDVPGRAYEIVVADGYAYMADWLYGLRIFDVSIPMIPTLVGTYKTDDYAYGVDVEGNYVFLANGNTGLIVLDVSDPAAPLPVGTYDANEYSLGVTAAGRYVYLSYESNGLRIADLFDPTSPTLAGSYDTPGRSFASELFGEYTCVADFQCGLTVLEFTPCTYWIIDPNGGEHWSRESSRDITWTSRNTAGYVDIEISTDGGLTWSHIIENTPNSGSYTWNVPLTLSENCLIRLTDAEDPRCFDISDRPFAIYSPCTITVMSPAGGESWCAGEERPITWVSDSTSGHMRIDYSTDGGTTWLTAASATFDDGRQPWTLPEAPSANCLVRISDTYYAECRDQSDSFFAVCDPPQASFSAEPLILQGDSCLVHFRDESSGCVTDWWWEFGDGEKNSEANPTHIYTCGPPYSVRLTATGPCGTDSKTMEDFITCQCPCRIFLTAPGGGEAWCSGETEQITWTSQSTGGRIRIDYSIDAGTNWNPIVENIPDDGLYSWIIPEVFSTACRVRVSDAEDPACFHSNEATFQICPCGDPAILTDQPAAGTQGCPYSDTLKAAGGCHPYTWTIAAGNLPPGLTINGATGVISGRPQQQGTVQFTARVSDIFDADDFKVLSIKIDEYIETKGDVNGDCAINSIDIVSTVNIVLGRLDPSAEEQWRADCNGSPGQCDGDGAINVLDVLKIANLILKLDHCP